MNPQQLRQVRRATDEAFRRELPVDFTLLVEAAASAGPVHWRDAAGLASRPKHGAVSRPMHLLEFVAELARSLRPASVLDVHVEAPTILAAAQDGSGSARTGGFVRDERIYAAAQHVAPADWRLGDPFALLRDLPPKDFDLVIAAPPLGLATTASEPGDPAGRIDYADLLVWRAASSVAAEGFLLFHTVDNFWWLADRRERWRDFAQRGLFPQAVVSVAKGLMPNGAIDTSMVLFGRVPGPQLFVGRLESDTSVETLVQNLVARRSDRDPYLGTLVPPDAYQGWRGAILARELAGMFRFTALRPLGEIAHIRSVRLRPGQLYEPPANAVFIPMLGMGDVRTMPPDSEKARERGFLEVQLDQELARAEYVAGVLSSAVGKRLRESAAIGATILRLGTREAGVLRLPVPPIAVQAEAIHSEVHLASMEATVARLRDELWRRPQDASRIIEQLEVRAKADPVRRWLETLPYPLAVILYRYVALRDPYDRYEGLLQFYEATAQFGCAVLLSILHADAELLASARRAIRGAPGRGRELFDRADFGTWINLGRTLAKAVHGHEKHAERKPQIEDAAGPAVELMRRLADKQVWVLLDQASKIRNRRYHGGVRTVAEAEARTEELEVLLGATELALASGFNDIDLMRADQGRFSGGTHTYPRAQRLRGANGGVFDEFEVRTRIPLESGHLAFVGRDTEVSKLLLLVPMIIVGGTKPESRNACYFFNKTLDDGRIRYVSYHFEDEPEIVMEQAELRQLGLDLRGPSTQSESVAG